jgi:2-C-methyl-D-erythritol 4-phosphate cytidylyltransferase/2-C-methyl-D-erythritol 2,4-cyclodiphosphate synthase
MRVAALIVAAGRGLRLGETVPKQYLPLGAKPVFRHSLDTFLAHPAISLVQVVICPEDRDRYDDAISGLDRDRLRQPVSGAAARAGSVLAGLETLARDVPEAVLIHDAARPFVTADLISATIAALDLAPGALPALPLVDALWREDDGIGASLISTPGGCDDCCGNGNL